MPFCAPRARMPSWRPPHARKSSRSRSRLVIGFDGSALGAAADTSSSESELSLESSLSLPPPSALSRAAEAANSRLHQSFSCPSISRTDCCAFIPIPLLSSFFTTFTGSAIPSLCFPSPWPSFHPILSSIFFDHADGPADAFSFTSRDASRICLRDMKFPPKTADISSRDSLLVQFFSAPFSNKKIIWNLKIQHFCCSSDPRLGRPHSR